MVAILRLALHAFDQFRGIAQMRPQLLHHREAGDDAGVIRHGTQLGRCWRRPLLSL